MSRRARQIALGLALCCGGLALLIWAKMKIVGSVPRTAYAEPEATHHTGPGRDAGPGRDDLLDDR